MPEWMEKEINREAKEQKKRWNGKVITTGRQWNENARGSREPEYASMNQIMDAYREYARNEAEWGW